MAFNNHPPVKIGLILWLIVIILGVAAYVDDAQADTKREVIIDCDKHKDNDVVALACNIYHEARSESAPGQWLVALATRNRVEDKHYPNTYAEVVWEIRRDARNGKMVCMFSWTCDGLHDRVYNQERWLNALDIAARLIGDNEGEIPDITYGCMWYHHVDIKPYWMDSYHPTIRIQRHQCYAANEEAFLKAMQELLPELTSWQSVQRAAGG